MLLNTRLEKCLKEYEKIDVNIINKYGLKPDDVQNILEIIFNEPETNAKSIWELITMIFKLGFVLGRKSIKDRG